MAADDTTATLPADEEGGKPGTGPQVSPADGGVVSGRRGGTGPALDLGWGKILVLMAWGFVVLAFAAGGLADVTRLWWLVLVFGRRCPSSWRSRTEGRGWAGSSPRTTRVRGSYSTCFGSAGS